eukprot:2503894-Pyramimonas_sp.AAC.2
MADTLRVYKRCRRHVQRGWLREHGRPYCYATARKSSERTVWAQFVFAEADRALMRHPATVMVELKKAFETIAHATLRAIGCRHQYSKRRRVMP